MMGYEVSHFEVYNWCVLVRCSECRLLPRSVGSLWFYDTDRPQSPVGGGAGPHLWDVHFCQCNGHPATFGQHHLQPHDHSEKVAPLLVCVCVCESKGVLILLSNFHRPSAPRSSRIQSLESEYLCAGSRLLCAACILQPKLSLYLKTVNSSQEQVFTLNISSARRWLHHNHSWANEVWLKWPTPDIHSVGFPGTTWQIK